MVNYNISCQSNGLVLTAGFDVGPWDEVHGDTFRPDHTSHSGDQTWDVQNVETNVVRLYNVKTRKYLAKADFDFPVNWEADGNYTSTWWRQEYSRGGFMLLEFDNPNFVLHMLGPDQGNRVFIRAKAAIDGQIWGLNPF